MRYDFLDFERDRAVLAQQNDNASDALVWSAPAADFDPSDAQKLWAQAVAAHPHASYDARICHAAATILAKARIAVLPQNIFFDKIEGQILVRRIREAQYAAAPAEKHALRAPHELAKSCGAYWSSMDISHVAPDWENLLAYGLPGTIDRLEAARKEHEAAGGLDSEQAAFYASALSCYHGLIALLERYETLAASLDTPQMRMAAQAMRNLRHAAPANIYEAMALMLFVYTFAEVVDSLFVRTLGRLDALLYPFYERDLAQGIFTHGEIRELLKYFMFVLTCKRHANNIPFSVGGYGVEKFAPLSLDILECFESLHETSPKLHLILSEDTPDALLDNVLRQIRAGNSSFCLIGDKTVTEAFLRMGRPLEQARNYTLVGCYEPQTCGKESGCTYAGGLNAAKAVEYALHQGIDAAKGARIGLATPPLALLTTYAHFYEAVKAQLFYLTERVLDDLRLQETFYRDCLRTPLTSGTFTECVQRGRDAYLGGILYPTNTMSVHALATLVDGLLAVKRIVYEEKKLSLEEFARVLDSNWEGQEALRQYARNHCRKFGVHDPEADALAGELYALIADHVNGQKNTRGGDFRLAGFSIDRFLEDGARTAATPDGRLHGEVLSKNLCATVGCDKQGVTALIQSCLALDHTRCPGGDVLDLMLHPSAVEGEAGVMAMKSLVKAYLLRGGMALQMNVTSADTLRAAQRDPASYANLQIRLCGWNVYFTQLSKAMQDDLIRRAE